MELHGSRWGEQQVLCPVHGERRPSLRVNLDKGLMFCHACSFKGNALNLVMAMESTDRAAASKTLDDILKAAGVELAPRARSRYQRPSEGRTQQITGRRYVPPGKRSA